METTSFVEEHQTFRDELASIERDGRRRWIYARQPSGRLYRARTIVSWFLLAFLLLAAVALEKRRHGRGDDDGQDEQRHEQLGEGETALAHARRL